MKTVKYFEFRVDNMKRDGTKLETKDEGSEAFMRIHRENLDDLKILGGNIGLGKCTRKFCPKKRFFLETTS